MSETEHGDHKAQMKKLQAEQAKRRRELKDPERGLVLVHTGDGKGKSSSAFGVMARALGWGQNVAVVQFIKGKWKTGEKQFFARFPDLVDWHVMGDGFTWDTQDRDRDIEAARRGLEIAKGFQQRQRVIGAGDGLTITHALVFSPALPDRRSVVGVPPFIGPAVHQPTP